MCGACYVHCTPDSNDFKTLTFQLLPYCSLHQSLPHTELLRYTLASNRVRCRVQCSRGLGQSRSQCTQSADPSNGLQQSETAVSCLAASLSCECVVNCFLDQQRPDVACLVKDCCLFPWRAVLFLPGMLCYGGLIRLTSPGWCLMFLHTGYQGSLGFPNVSIHPSWILANKESPFTNLRGVVQRDVNNVPPQKCEIQEPQAAFIWWEEMQ